MRTSAVPALFVATILFAPLAAAQRQSPGEPSGSAAPASAAAAQRQSDEILGRTYMATKRYAEAAAVYQKLAKAYPREPSYLNLIGIAYMQNGDSRGARRWFERAIKLEPRFADAYNNLGASWYTQKNFKRALQYYQRAVALQPGVASYHSNVGYAYFSMKRVVEAEQSFRRALLMDPFVFQQNGRTGSVVQDRSVTDKGLFAFTMAQSYANTGDALDCAGYLRRALDEGYKDMAQVYTDPSFAAVLSDPGIQAVLALIPSPGGQSSAAPAAQ